MLRSIVVGLVLVVAAETEAQGTLVVSQNKCAADKQAQITRMLDSLWIPVGQELVNEGKLTGMGTASHLWGDEWNIVLWYTAATTQGFLDGFAELVRRVQQRHPTLMTQFMGMCTEHKDSMYSMGRSTVPPPAAPVRRP